jgi:putative addiction module component (TIGR02574 family)
MTQKAEFLLKEAMNMSPDDRAMLAHCLISSLDEPHDNSVDEHWIQLAEERLSDLDSGKTSPVSWNEIKKKIK